MLETMSEKAEPQDFKVDLKNQHITDQKIKVTPKVKLHLTAL